MTNHENHLASREEKVRGLIENLSSYIEYYHGGWVKLISLDGSLLKVQLGGACEGCHLSSVTLKGWVTGTVRQFFPDIEEVVAV